MDDTSSNDSFMSAAAAGIASVLLYSQGCTLSASLLFLCFLYFVRRVLPEEKLKAPKDFNVVIVGSGVSGICMGKRLGELGVKYTILEKSKNLGGTWYDNIYPGVACDVPSHLYSFSFMQNPNWSRAFSKGKEIHNYLKNVASRFGVYPNVHYEKRVTTCNWDEKKCLWTVETEDGSVYVANVLISCCGGLHVPRQAVFKGMEDFKGDSFHTALWKKHFDPAGKRIAVIGTGASAVQTVPNLGEMGVKSLTVYQRSACWAPPRLDYEYPAYVRMMFTYLPFTNTILRWFYFWRNESRYHILMASKGWLGDYLSDYIHNLVKKHYKHVLKDPALIAKLTPSYNMGCKRITPSDTYLQTFTKDNVHLVTDKIDEIDATGIKTVDGTHREFDAIVYATGFDLLKSANPYKLKGAKGKDMGEAFGDTPSGLYGIVSDIAPNYFWLLGPGTGLAHNSIIYMIECQTNYTIDAMTKMVNSGARAMIVKTEVVKNYWNWVQENMKGKVFADNSGCVGWYRNARGVNWTLWPKDLVSYWWNTKSANIDDFHLTY